MTKHHNWTIEEVDGGNLGIGEFWICYDCGASGGPVLGPTPKWKPFLAGTTPSLKLGDDCDVARALIAAYEAGKSDTNCTEE